MANSYYAILEYRAVIDGDVTHLYVCISDANDFMPISGWYKKTIDKDTPSLSALQEAITKQQYLLGDGWSREAPKQASESVYRQKALDMVSLVKDDVVRLLKEKWTFDEHQCHTHTWHEFQDTLDEIRKLQC